MTLCIRTAYEVIQNGKPSVKFTDERLTRMLKKGRLAIGELCLVRASIEQALQTVSTMLNSMNTDDVIHIRYSRSEVSTSENLLWVHADSLHALIRTLKCISNMPRVLILIDDQNLLAGFKVNELVAIISELMRRHVIVVTNCLNVASLATQIIDL
jgi:hypothetical protein